MDAGELLKQYASSTGTDHALTALFALWGARYEIGGTRSCQQASEQGLECVFQKGSWELLRSLNRPAILHLTDEQGAAHQVVIMELSAASARLMLDQRIVSVTTASLSRYWNGDYLLLWRPKVTDNKVLSVGNQGSEVLWLRRALAQLKNESVSKQASDKFDDGLAAALADFQRAHRLHPDGIAGLQTQVALDAATVIDGSPTLVRSSEALPNTTASGQSL